MSYKNKQSIHQLVDNVSISERNGKKIIQKGYQSLITAQKNRSITSVFTPAPNTKALTTGSQIKLYLEAKTCRIMKSASLRFSIATANSGSKYPPVSYWFSKIEFFHRNSGVGIQTVYDDVMHLLVNQKDESDRNELNEFYYQNENYSQIHYNQKTNNTENYFYLPLNNIFFENMLLDLYTVNTDIEIRLHCRSSILNANDDLKEVAIVIDEIYPDQLSQKHHIDNLNNHIMSHTFLDTQHYVENRTMAAGSTYYFDLDQFDKKANALLVALKPNGSNLPDSYDLGKGTFDIVGVNGESLLGGGREIVVDHHMKAIKKQWGNDYFHKTKQLLIPFNNIKKAINGSMAGYFQFDQSKMKLKITTPQQESGATPAVGHGEWTLMLNQVLDATCMCDLNYRGRRAQLAYNASQADIITAFNSIMQDYGVQAIAGGAGTFSTGVLMHIKVTQVGNGQKLKKSDAHKFSPELKIHSTSTTKIFSVKHMGLINFWNDTVHWPTTPQNIDCHIYMLHNKVIEQQGQQLSVLDMN